MTELSPAAQVVLEAYSAIQWRPGEGHRVQRIAAILRAAVNQVVSETTTPWNSTLTPIMSTPEVRAKLLAIATELERF